MICYDREYPESARELMLQGAELILVPNDCDNMRPRLRELSVRAIENMTGIAMANPPGPGAGRSCAYSPVAWDRDDNTILLGDERTEEIYLAAFDLDEIRANPRGRGPRKISEARSVPSFAENKGGAP